MGRMGAEDPARVSRAVPLVDLKAQHAAIAAEVQAAIDNVMSNTDFILGADVAEFETRACRRWSSACARWASALATR